MVPMGGRALRLRDGMLYVVGMGCHTLCKVSLIFFGYQDVGLPYICDKRHQDDTLFICCEADFRYYEADCLLQEDWIASLASSSLAPSIATGQPPPPPSDPSPDQPSADPVAPPPPPPPRLGNWERSSATRGRPTAEEMSEELRDVVRCCTAAHREGLGDLVWLSWNGSANKRRGSPSYGSQMIAYTRLAALEVKRAMVLSPPQHYDTWLRALLETRWAEDAEPRAGDEAEPRARRVWGASYVWPSIGNFDEHVSGCDLKVAGDGVRKSQWKQSWVQAGVRPRFSDDRPRWICTKAPGVGIKWHRQVCFDDDRSLEWWTASPPRVWWSQDPTWRNLLWQRWWLNWNDEFQLPGFDLEARREQQKKLRKRAYHGGASRPSEGKGGASSPSGVTDPYRFWWDLLERPDEFRWTAAEGWSEITKLAEQLVVDWADFSPLGNYSYTDRMKRNRRDQVSMYKKRNFAGETNLAAHERFTKKK